MLFVEGKLCVAVAEELYVVVKHSVAVALQLCVTVNTELKLKRSFSGIAKENCDKGTSYFVFNLRLHTCIKTVNVS